MTRSLLWTHWLSVDDSRIGGDESAHIVRDTQFPDAVSVAFYVALRNDVRAGYFTRLCSRAKRVAAVRELTPSLV
jgi:hypothetical protein